MHDGNELIQFTYCYKTVAWLLFLERDLIVVVVVFFFTGKSWVDARLFQSSGRFSKGDLFGNDIPSVIGMLGSAYFLLMSQKPHRFFFVGTDRRLLVLWLI